MKKELDKETILRGYEEKDVQYYWIVKSPYGRLKTLSETALTTISVVIIGPLFFTILLWIISVYFDPIGFWISVLGGLFSLIAYLISFGLKFFAKTTTKKEEWKKVFPAAAVFTAACLIAIMSSPLFYPDQFHGSISNPWEWILFFMDNLLSIILANIPAHLGWVLSDITSKGWLGDVMISIFRGVLATEVIYFIFNINDIVITEEETYGSYEEFYSKYSTETFGELEIVIKGRIRNLDVPVLRNYGKGGFL